MPRFLRSSSVMWKTFSSTGSASGYSFSMPSRPAASMTANARYGLQAGSGERYSMRVAISLPGLYSGTRTMSERLRRAQVM